MFYLTLATVILGVLLLIKGLAALIWGPSLIQKSMGILYNRPAAIALWAVAVLWTLWEVTKLGPADFGSFKNVFLILFAFLGVASVWMLKDYLIVRAASVLWLYVSWWLLKAAFLQPPWTRLFFVTLVYVIIIKALWLAVAPWRARDMALWLAATPARWKIAASITTAYGVLLLVVAATYRWVT